MDVKAVKGYVAGRLNWLAAQPEHPQKANLANLRRGVGKTPGELPLLWGLMMDGLPEQMQSKTGEPTQEEWAVYLALTLYALHQQGHPLPAENMNRPGIGLGSAVRRLVKEGEDLGESRAIKRLNRLANAADIRAAAAHLRGIVQLLCAEGIPLDYAQLAADLYMLRSPTCASRVKLRWGQDFYRTKTDTDTTEIEKEN